MRMIKLAAASLLALSFAAVAAPVLNTSDFISTPTHFNGFENVPNDGQLFTGGAGPYVENGIRVTQVGGDTGNDIWVTLGGLEGNFSWYPNGGDNGYTLIQLDSGADFTDLSLLFRSYNAGDATYELLDDGVSILKGTLSSSWGAVTRIGFAGGGFDQVLLRGGLGGNFGDGAFQALQIDSVKVGASSTVPEPAGLALMAAAMGAMAAVRRRRQS